MGKCETTIKRVTFDFEDEQATKVEVQIDFAGDCPIQLKRVYTKTFPARYSAINILQMDGGVTDYLNWD